MHENYITLIYIAKYLINGFISKNTKRHNCMNESLSGLENNNYTKYNNRFVIPYCIRTIQTLSHLYFIIFFLQVLGRNSVNDIVVCLYLHISMSVYVTVNNT